MAEGKSNAVSGGAGIKEAQLSYRFGSNSQGFIDRLVYSNESGGGVAVQTSGGYETSGTATTYIPGQVTLIITGISPFRGDVTVSGLSLLDSYSISGSLSVYVYAVTDENPSIEVDNHY